MDGMRQSTGLLRLGLFSVLFLTVGCSTSSSRLSGTSSPVLAAHSAGPASTSLRTRPPMGTPLPEPSVPTETATVFEQQDARVRTAATRRPELPRAGRQPESTNPQTALLADPSATGAAENGSTPHAGSLDLSRTDLEKRAEILRPNGTSATPAVMPMPEDPSSRPDEAVPAKLVSFAWPARGRITSGFGKLADGKMSNGLHIAVPDGAPVHAAADGKIIYAGNGIEQFGNLILIDHGNNWVSAYAHNKKLNVSRGDTVARGDMIANAGSSGIVEETRLHFELRNNSRPLDPLPYLTAT